MIDAMQQALQEAFRPTQLSLIDESAAHASHASARAHGGGHFRLEIAASDLSVLPRVRAHQAIYRVLDPWFQSGAIHALSIHIHS